MTKKKTEKEYQEWMEDVLGRAPEGVKTQLKAVLEDPAGMDLFNGHLREREFHRRLSEIDAARQAIENERREIETGKSALANDVAKIETWVKTEVPKFDRMKSERDRAFAERDALKAHLEEYGITPEPTSGGPVKMTKTNDEPNGELLAEVQRLRQQVAMMDATVPGVLADFGSVLVRANKEGFDIDPKTLIEHSMQKTGSLTRSYEDLTADQRQKKAEEQYKAEIEKAKEEARREALSQMGTPDRFKPAGPSTFEQIKGPGKTPDERVGAAVAEWNRLISENPASLAF